MTTRPTRATPGGRAYLDLRKAASEAGRPTDELLQLYALEGLLDRLVGSAHADRFVLKGGVLLAAFDARRPTRDIDLAAIDLASDRDELRAMINEVLTVSSDDGLEFDPASTTAEAIRDDALYGGVRVTVHGSLSTAVIQFHVDINLGDPLWPPPHEVEVPRVLGGSPIRIRGYRVELVLAEKIVTHSSGAPPTPDGETSWTLQASPAAASMTESWSNRSDGSPRSARPRSSHCVGSLRATRKSHSNVGPHGGASKASPPQHQSDSKTSSARFSPSPTRCSIKPPFNGRQAALYRGAVHTSRARRRRSPRPHDRGTR